MRFKRHASATLSLLVLAVFCAVLMLPFFWMLSASLKQESKMFIFPPQWIPNPAVPENYANVFRHMPMLNYLGNSFKITALVLLGGAAVASMAGFAFSKLDFTFRSALFLLPLCSMMIPNEVIVIPLFRIWGGLGFVNTHVPLIVPHIVGAGGMFGVFLMRQYYLSIPSELCEAAKIDGCNPFSTYVRIFLPLSGPAIATLSIYNFMNAWNDFFDPLIYLSSAKLYTIPLGLSLFADSQTVQWSELMAASVIATAPLLIMFFLAQRKFMESVALSGLKT